jgi:hypothetical protein
MSITVSILITATLVHIRTVETKPLITSTETKCVMGAATQAEAATRAEATARNSYKLKANGCRVETRTIHAHGFGKV